VVRPAVVYGCETWVLRKKSEIKLDAWERKMMREIFKGSKAEDGGWRKNKQRAIQAQQYSDKVAGSYRLDART
jgi:hypothetical protein